MGEVPDDGEGASVLMNKCINNESWPCQAVDAADENLPEGII